jgi:PhzF family phenazine biosynthesis protein
MDNSKKIDVQILNAFVDNNRGGNPAGVVLNADDLTNEQKLKIASKIGLSETAFVSRSASADFKLDFFTPTRQIAHCGHATIATFSYLSQTGLIKSTASSKETIDGRR